MKHYLYISLICTCLIVACSKDPNYLFEVENVEINQASDDKNRLKTDIEFVSIAYNDLYGQNISQGELDDIITVYKSFGDKSLVIEMIIRKFISNEDSQIPNINRASKQTVEQFVQETYETIFNRTPNAFEKWYLTDYIQNHQEIDAEMIYYALMTSNEYRYY
tara:strand:- start:172 stop:660 length:489 start_codon:yes stop_codon:yes gene_type:complete